jgi:malate dehydrogenase (oxaloacetate-decarboxylating)
MPTGLDTAPTVPFAVDRQWTDPEDEVRRSFRLTADGAWETTDRGLEVLQNPPLNKGVAFGEEERHALGLVGLLPPAVLTLEEQAHRAHGQYRAQATALGAYVYLKLLHDRNEVLYYRLLTDHLHEMLPVVYTPTVGEAIKHYSHEYRRPRGVFLSIDHPDEIEVAFANFGVPGGDVDLVVATDGEAILGIGDWGVGGIDIAVGKLAVYTAAAGVDPTRVIPVMLDVGTDNQALLDDPFYVGNRHPRVRDERYDEFIDTYVATVTGLFPGVLLHWEDFGPSNARRILDRHRHRICTFNDDMQGTGATVLAAVLSGTRSGGVPLEENRVVVFGAGTAGCGIADQIRDAMVKAGLPREEATRRFWCIDRPGLLTDDMEGLRDFQRPYARPVAEVAGWERQGAQGGITLEEVVRRVQPTVLIGTSAVPGAFTEPVVREMAAHVLRPVILPLSNPTELAEAEAGDLLAWTAGRALVATGSPAEPVTHDRVTHVIAQANNALLFPGLGLGAIVSRAGLVTDGMLAAAAAAVAGAVDAVGPGSALLPLLDAVRDVSVAVACAVARAATEEGVATAELDDVEAAVRAAMWEPAYRPVRPRPAAG